LRPAGPVTGHWLQHTEPGLHIQSAARQTQSQQSAAKAAAAWRQRQPCLVRSSGGDVNDGSIARRHVRQARLAHQESSCRKRRVDDSFSAERQKPLLLEACAPAPCRTPLHGRNLNRAAILLGKHSLPERCQWKQHSLPEDSCQTAPPPSASPVRLVSITRRQCATAASGVSGICGSAMPALEGNDGRLAVG